MDTQKKRKIFLADDDKDTRHFLKKILERKNYEAICFSDGKELIGGLESEKEKPQIVITDFEMPYVNGLELTKIVKSKFPNLPVIMISGGLPLANNPADSFLEKPLDLQRLVEEIEKLSPV